MIEIRTYMICIHNNMRLEVYKRAFIIAVNLLNFRFQNTVMRTTVVADRRVPPNGTHPIDVR